MSNKSVVSGTLKGLLNRYVAFKADAVKIEKELKELKTKIDAELDQVAKKNGFNNGKLAVPGVCLVTVALNPAKLVWAVDSASLSAAEKEGVALIVPDRFVQQSVNQGEIFKAIERGDKELKTLLVSKGIEAVQESRYEIKAA